MEMIVMANACTLITMAHMYYRTCYKIPVIFSPSWVFSNTASQILSWWYHFWLSRGNLEPGHSLLPGVLFQGESFGLSEAGLLNVVLRNLQHVEVCPWSKVAYEQACPIFSLIKTNPQQSMVIHTCNPSTLIHTCNPSIYEAQGLWIWVWGRLGVNSWSYLKIKQKAQTKCDHLGAIDNLSS